MLFFGLAAAPVLSIANVVSTGLTYVHITGFWRLKPEVSFVTGFNEGIRKSNDLRLLFVLLGMAWAFTDLIGIFESQR